MGLREITKRLFGLRSGKTTHYRQLPVVPAGVRLYAIGDIHGRDDLLRVLLAKIDEEAGNFTGRVILVFLGDYIDRGMHSRQVLETLVELEQKSSHELIFLLGNHEQSMLDFLSQVRGSENWLRYGGLETLQSYNVHISSQDLGESSLQRIRQSFRDNLDAAHLAFLRRLRLSYTLGDYFFAHAGVRPGIALKAQVIDDLLWMREPFLSSNQDFGRIVVHGHSITETPVVRQNRIAIDTGAFASGRLTSLVLEGDARRFLTTA